jgi:hypothetical protein
MAPQRPDELGSQDAQAIQLGPDLAQPLAQQLLGVAAGAHSGHMQEMINEASRATHSRTICSV